MCLLARADMYSNRGTSSFSFKFACGVSSRSYLSELFLPVQYNCVWLVAELEVIFGG